MSTRHPYRLCLVLGFLSGIWPAAANLHVSKEKELKLVEEELENKRQKAQKLAGQNAELHKKIEAIQKSLVEAAETARHYEQRITQAESTLVTLSDQEKHRTGVLYRNQGTWSHVLILIHHFSKASPISLFMTQKDPHQVVQSTMVLKSVVPYLQEITDRLKTELDHLRSLRQAIADERMMLAQAQESLSRKQTHLKDLLKQKSDLEKSNKGEQEILERRIRLLGAQADNLRDLLAELEAEQAVGVYRKPKGASSTLAKRSHKKPFKMIPPVHGPIIVSNQRTEQRLGVVYAPASGAQVLSPAHGKVVFSGPFRSYKYIVIIDHGQGWHTLFSGISQGIIPVGQEVLEGQPIGIMPSSPKQSSKLYMELRQNGEPIDPTPWLVKP